MIIPPAERLLREGLGLMREKNFQAALDKFEEAERADPRAMNSVLAQGFALNRLERFREALPRLLRAEAGGARTRSLDREIGAAAVNLGQWRLAAVRLERFEKAGPGNGRTALLLGRAFLGLRQFGRAEHALRLAMRRSSRLRPEVIYQLAWLERARGNGAAALEHLRVLREQAPGSPQAAAAGRILGNVRSRTGLALFDAGKYKAALAEFAAAAAAGAGPEVLVHQGATLNRLDQYREALAALYLADKAGVRSPRLDLEIGVSAVNLGSWQVAADRLERYEAARPGGARTALLLGRAYTGLGEYGEADTRLRAAMERDPSMRPEALYRLAQLEQVRGDMDAAHERLAQLERAAPDSEQARKLKKDLPAPAKTWQASASLTFGHNDNVLQTPDGPQLVTDVTDEASNFWSFSAGLSYRWEITRDDVLTPGVFIQGTEYKDVGTANSLSPSAILTYVRRLPFDVEATSSIGYGRTRVDDADFNRSLTANASAAYGATDWLKLVAGYGFARTDYDRDPTSAAQDRDSRTHVLSLTGYFILPDLEFVKTRLRLGLSQTWNDTDGTDFDYISRSGSLGVTFNLPWEVSLDGDVNRAETDYDEPNSQATPAFAFARDDSSMAYSVRLSRSIADGLGAFFSFQRSNSNSNITDFEYTQNTWSLGINRSF